MTNVRARPWWGYLERDLQELLVEAQMLNEEVAGWERKFIDYSFIVFPAAKAYEGFLKKLFLDLGFISEADYYGKRFRIGRALSPTLRGKARKRHGVYDKLKDYCKGDDIPKKLWRTWKMCRNRLFHWFPDSRNTIDYEEAEDRIEMIIGAIDAVYGVCKIDLGK